MEKQKKGSRHLLIFYKLLSFPINFVMIIHVLGGKQNEKKYS